MKVSQDTEHNTNPYIDNSFFHQHYKNVKVLLFVPHQDDEINAAASLLFTLARCEARITLVYTTNGDWECPAAVRFNEAIDAAGVLGIPEKNILFMGYGDTLNRDDKRHVFYHTDTPARSAAGHTETYGTVTHPDFVFLQEKQHHSYTNENYLKDLLSIIRLTKSDLIIGTDFDCHADHRMLSLYLDKAIGMIRKEDPSYQPEVWKRFAYPLAFNAVADYSSVNNPATKLPVVGVTHNYRFAIIGFFYFIWKERIRIPVPAMARTDTFRDNIICKALEQHRSQRIVTEVTRILSSDEIFWSRRTDCVSHTAEISVSSGNGTCLNDFMVYNVDNIDEDIAEYTDYCWRPEAEDPDKTAVFKWKKPVTVEKIVLYGAVSTESKIDRLLVTMSNGFSQTVTALPPNGNPLEIVTGKQDNITSCTLKILSATGADYGISECEIYSSKEFTSHIVPFCKILIEDNFAYEYFINKNVKVLPLAVYTYGNTGSITLTVENGTSVIWDGKLYIADSDQEIFIRAQNENGSVWDQIIIKRLSWFDLKRKKLSDIADRIYLKKRKRQLKQQLK